MSFLSSFGKEFSSSMDAIGGLVGSCLPWAAILLAALLVFGWVMKFLF